MARSLESGNFSRAAALLLPTMFFIFVAGCGVETSSGPQGEPRPALISQEEYDRKQRRFDPSHLIVRPYQEWTLPETAVDALGRIGRPAVDRLTTALHDPDPAIRRRAAEVLGRIGPEAAAAVPALRQALDDRDEEVRRLAVRALGQIGPEAEAAVGDLMALLKDTPPKERVGKSP